MSEADHRNPQQPHPDQGWQPLPQGGEYESEATAFVQLPEGFTTGIYGRRTPGYTPGADPLAAPGHGYTPPASFASHTTAPQVPGADTDPAATGQWTMPFADPAAGYADPSAGYADQMDTAAHQGRPAAYQGGAPEAAQPWSGEPVDWPVAGSPEAGGTGSWSVPAAADDGLEESGEYLVGDGGLTGRTGVTRGRPNLPGHPEHPGHAGHQGLTGPGGAGHQGGGYPGAGAYDAVDPAEAAQTGHWNFTAGLGATHGAQTHATPAQEAPQGPAVPDRFGGPAGDPYARDGGLADHDRAMPGHGTAPTGEPAGDAADPYGTGAGASATGHWSLPADALAQWPPADDAAPRHEAADRHDAAVDVPAPAGAGGWDAPAAEGERPERSGEFAPGDGAAEPAEPASTASVDPADSGAPDDPAGHGGPAEPGDPTGLAAVAAPAGGTAPSGAPAHEGAVPADDPGPADTEAPVGAPDAAADHDPAAAADAHDEHPAASYVLRVNGIDRPVTDAWIGESLLYVLRERLGLAGAKDGCSQGECGACSVQVDGRLVASCLVPAATTAGSEVRTVEGLAQNGVPSDVQRALAASGAVQCGFCVPGMAMTVHDLLEGNHAPSELETRKALCGNLCRCSGYRGVLDAVEEVVKARTEAAYAQEDDASDGPDGPAEAAPADTARIPHQAGPADPMGHAPHHQDPQTGGSA
ncbi:2Fe-2S iron-sulfur cluster-binding protein [Streptomyces sp. NPDC050355]|uniref:2Fe-2S iron-sulfur cluster-binding protein n=1 Tax=Streptomyces sp. NPDC050355 TaxID=3365609 RepID=UPI00378AC759